MYPHMKALGCDEIAALASEKLNLKMHVVQTSDMLSVWQQSQLGVVHRSLHIGQDTQESSSQGDRKVWVTIGPKEITVDTKFKNGRLLDTRTLDRDRATGDTIMCTTMTLTIRQPSNTVRTRRYFRRVGEPDPEIVNMPVDQIATLAGLPPPTAQPSQSQGQLGGASAGASGAAM